jgi:hypothetical protein
MEDWTGFARMAFIFGPSLESRGKRRLAAGQRNPSNSGQRAYGIRSMAAKIQRERDFSIGFIHLPRHLAFTFCSDCGA